jgi:hypothetical protein
MAKSLSQKIEAGEFRNDDTFPTDENLAKDIMWQEAIKKEKELSKKLAAVLEVKDQIKQRMKKEYRQAEGRIRDDFRKACEEEFGTSKWPKEARDKVWQKAWEDGHAHGYSEIYDEYSEVADFARSMAGIVKQR